jgi:hypothetical protein
MSPFQDPEAYRYILDGLQIGVSVLDLEKRIVFWSDGQPANSLIVQYNVKNNDEEDTKKPAGAEDAKPAAKP